jgi:hypothetical protein
MNFFGYGFLYFVHAAAGAGALPDVCTRTATISPDNDTLYRPTLERNAVPKYIFVSDSIILSAPLMQGNYDGLDIVVVKCIQVAQKDS